MPSLKWYHCRRLNSKQFNWWPQGQYSWSEFTKYLYKVIMYSKKCSLSIRTKWTLCRYSCHWNWTFGRRSMQKKVQKSEIPHHSLKQKQKQKIGVKIFQKAGMKKINAYVYLQMVPGRLTFFNIRLLLIQMLLRCCLLYYYISCENIAKFESKSTNKRRQKRILVNCSIINPPACVSYFSNVYVRK